MNVQIINQQKEIVSVPVKANWIGGQQAIIVPPNTHDKYEYYILIEAQEHGVFNVEARTSGAVIKLKENNLRFDSIKEGQQLCYEFNLKNKNDLVVEAKLIKGEVDFVFTSPEGKVEKANKIQNDKDLKETIASATKGLWQICAKTNSQVAFYSLHVYSNVVNAKEYKNILYSLLTKEELYDFQNREDSSRLNTLPMMRMLQEDQANEQPADTATNESDANTSNTTNNLETEVVPATTAANLSPIIVGLHISGTGVAGLVTVFVFLTPVLIGCYALMSIFVNTKFSDQPLKLGKID